MQSSSSWIYILLVIIALALGGGWYLANRAPVPVQTPTTTPPASTPPATQPTTSPATTTPATSTPQATYKNASPARIVIDSPKPGASVPKTFTVSGKAVGGWYFEANFPYELLDAEGKRLVQGPVQAQGEWMTPNFVPFSFQVTIPANYKGAATLVLHNDNPSGLPENAASISIPITVQ